MHIYIYGSMPLIVSHFLALFTSWPVHSAIHDVFTAHFRALYSTLRDIFMAHFMTPSWHTLWCLHGPHHGTCHDVWINLMAFSWHLYHLFKASWHFIFKTSWHTSLHTSWHISWKTNWHTSWHLYILHGIHHGLFTAHFIKCSQNKILILNNLSFSVVWKWAGLYIF